MKELKMQFEVGQIIKFYSIDTSFINPMIRYSIIREIHNTNQIGIEINNTTKAIIGDELGNIYNCNLTYIYINKLWKIEVLDIDEVEYKLIYGDIIYDKDIL